ncbi:MAG: undecaprenyl-diphosphate phosphatase [Alphaproteobacteria bacterium]|nr:undecaprenyl-diphosphate phosphatase [Alphaproteobacteria bacterium SS10]
MPLWHLAILALIQGITEFLPISSSAHLVLAPVVLGTADQGLLVDIAVHVGTLVAVCVYFWRETLQLPVGTVKLLGKSRNAPEAKLALHVILASIPIVIAGFTLHSIAPGGLRAIELIAWSTIIFGILLGVADWIGAKRKSVGSMDRLDAILIGLAQILALIPGTSRSGITMTMARFIGYSRQEAARFSLLLSIPAIGGAAVLGAIDVYQAGSWRLGLDLAVAAVLAGLSAFAAIAVMMRWLSKASFMPFVVYRLLLGAVLLAYIYL